MTAADRTELTEQQLDAVAWDFLNSEFAAKTYSIWPMDRRVDAYLRHCGRDRLINDGAIYDALIQRVMANIGRALRRGLLVSPEKD
jgi:hypothetical protein